MINTQNYIIIWSCVQQELVEELAAKGLGMLSVILNKNVV